MKSLTISSTHNTPFPLVFRAGIELRNQCLLTEPSGIGYPNFSLGGASMTHIDVPLVRSRFGETSRPDNWWVQPLLVFLGLFSFIVYSTWSAFQGRHFRFGPYLSPFYSPELLGDPLHAWFGAKPQWIPSWVTAAMLILWAPGGFRVTCYYYRGAYYKAFWADPPSCTVGEPRTSYLGERSFPLILQNVHRYFLYLALLFILVLAHDVWKALWFVDPATGRTSF